MIEIKNLTNADVGRWVVYNDGIRPPERGRIKSWNEKYVFVVYERPGRDMSKFREYTAVATAPEDLNFCGGVEIVRD